jgi:hypothetical protein
MIVISARKKNSNNSRYIFWMWRRRNEKVSMRDLGIIRLNSLRAHYIACHVKAFFCYDSLFFDLLRFNSIQFDLIFDLI